MLFGHFKIKSLLSICIVASFLLSSCTSATPQYEKVVGFSAPKVPAKITLRFASSWGGVDAKADTLQEIINKFNDTHPDIEVINESTYGEDFLHKLKTDFASGYDPDVFGLWPGSDIRALVNAGKVADLTEIINKDTAWKSHFAPESWRYTTFDKKIYGLPTEVVYECMFINRDLFTRHNVKVPRTYNDLKQAVADFQGTGIIPIACNSTSEGSYLYQNFIVRLGTAEDIGNPVRNGKISQCYIEGMKYVKELYDLKAFPENVFSLSSRERDEMFIYKRAAMIAQGSWFRGRFDDDDTTVDIIQFPIITDNPNSNSDSIIYGFGNGCFYMSQQTSLNSSKKEASIKLMQALTSTESASLLVKKTGMISNITSVDSALYSGRLRVNEQGIMAAARDLIGPPDSFVDRSIWENRIVKQLPYVLTGEKTPEQVWQESLSSK